MRKVLTSTFVAIFVTVTLASCSGEPTLGDIVIKQGEDIASIGKQWNSGQKLMEEGEKQLAEGNDKIVKGQDKIEQGKSLKQKSEQICQQTDGCWEAMRKVFGK
ncbi:MAG: hypothetical protein BWK79_17420 [Beggiatoa sp. IS2]|nr:MAG: hypothetical protein BWK79_17420 [Beggiatoa sp. IS2]